MTIAIECKVEVYRSNGQLVRSFGQGILKDTVDITATNDGSVMVLQGNSCVHVFDAEGSHVHQFKVMGNTGTETGAAMTFHQATDHTFIASTNSDHRLQVSIHDKDGGFLRSIQLHEKGKWCIMGIAVTMQLNIAVSIYDEYQEDSKVLVAWCSLQLNITLYLALNYKQKRKYCYYVWLKIIEISRKLAQLWIPWGAFRQSFTKWSKTFHLLKCEILKGSAFHGPIGTKIFHFGSHKGFFPSTPGIGKSCHLNDVEQKNLPRREIFLDKISDIIMNNWVKRSTKDIYLRNQTKGPWCQIVDSRSCMMVRTACSEVCTKKTECRYSL